MDTIVLWNAGAGSAGAAEQLYRLLHDHADVELCPVDFGDCHRDDLVSRMSSFGRVIAAGGDGTVNAVISAAIHSKHRPLVGVLPLGTGNDLARTLQMPLDPLAAWSLLEQDTLVRQIDVIEYRTGSQSGYSANMLTGGNTGRYLNALTDEQKQRWGPYCYLRGVVDILRDLRSYEVQLTYETGGSEIMQVINLFLANGRTSGGGLTVCPQAEPDDGLIDMVIVKEGNAGEIATLAADYVLSSFTDHELIETRRVREVIISADQSMPLTADGENIGAAPVRVRLRPAAVRMMTGTPRLKLDSGSKFVPVREPGGRQWSHT